MNLLPRRAILLCMFASLACSVGPNDVDPDDSQRTIRGKADVVNGSCEPADCGFQSLDGCWCDVLCQDYGDCCEDVVDVCELDDVCSAQDALGQGPCLTAIGYVWDGMGCEVVSGCDCAGNDCDALFDDLDTCLAERIDCTDDVPPTCDELGGQCRSSPADEGQGADCESDFAAATLAGTCEAFNLTCCATAGQTDQDGCP